jgi:hypothetical protein
MYVETDVKSRIGDVKDRQGLEQELVVSTIRAWLIQDYQAGATKPIKRGVSITDVLHTGAESLLL